MRRPATGLGLGLGLLLCLLTPSLAEAGNGTHIRTPVDWSGAPCMTVIDRSLSPIHAFDYAVPYEDTMLTEDEVADSRTHQFLAFCRDRSLDELLPGWISEADIGPAVDKGLGDPAELDLELDVLANNPQWTDCWARITADDERRPITFAAAAEPVVWDTSGLAPGAWVVDGYTHEPWYNFWTPHPGVFKIVDDPDPAASGPAASLDGPEQEVEFGDSVMIRGCVDAMPGTTMSLSWALSNPNGALAWTLFEAELPAQTGAFELPFEPPIETVSNPVQIRLELVDPMGRSWTAYSRNPIGVLDTGQAEAGCSDPFGGCDEGETGAAETGGTSESSGGASEAGSGGGCACAAGPGLGPGRGWAGLGGLLLLGVAGLGERRRRRAMLGR